MPPKWADCMIAEGRLLQHRPKETMPQEVKSPMDIRQANVQAEVDSVQGGQPVGSDSMCPVIFSKALRFVHGAAQAPWRRQLAHARIAGRPEFCMGDAEQLGDGANGRPTVSAG